MTAPATTNRYADDKTVPFTTNAVLPDEVAEAYLVMQERHLNSKMEWMSETHNDRHYITVLFSATKEQFAEAYAAGYESAHRCLAQELNPIHWNCIAIRSMTGIAFTSGGILATAFKAGQHARVRDADSWI